MDDVVRRLRDQNQGWASDEALEAASLIEAQRVEIERLQRRDRDTFMAGFDAGADIGWEAAKDDSSGVPNPGGAFLAQEAYEKYLRETTKVPEECESTHVADAMANRSCKLCGADAWVVTENESTKDKEYTDPLTGELLNALSDRVKELGEYDQQVRDRLDVLEKGND